MSTNAEESNPQRFPSPFDVATPPGAEGWERLYPYYLLFSEDNRTWEDSVFWFQESMHHPEVQLPFETITHECIRVAIGQYNSRIFALPPAYGLEQRILNGYVYFTSVPVTDPDWLQERVAIFMRRAGHYYEHWDELFEQWKAKMEQLIRSLQAIAIPQLPRLEDEQIVFEGRGISSGYTLLSAYNQVIENIFVAWQYHFEMLTLGYAAYLNLFQFCRHVFPGITDEVVSQMVAGTDILFFRPDDELKRLAQLALELGLADRIRRPSTPESILAELRADPDGLRWAEALDAAKEPWFYFSNGNGFYHHHRSWVDDLTVPWTALCAYIDRLERGESLERPRRAILEHRDRLTEEYRDLLRSDDERAVFDQNIALARKVSGYVEDHNFYVEHWHHTIFWNRMREFGDRLVTARFLAEREDVFFLSRWELAQALYEAVATWATGAPARGPQYWTREVADRKRIVAALRAVPPPPALGPINEGASDPLIVMLFGITPERVSMWLSGKANAEAGTVHGIAASPGVVTGVVRVVHSASDLPLVQQDEILVCPCTAPSWGPVFGKIKATISDIGGMMSHAAIICREYGLPAIVGTGNATTLLKTGDRVSVDGGTGRVTILS